MDHSISRRRPLQFHALCLTLTTLCGVTAQAADAVKQDKKRPDFAVVEKVVRKHFESKDGFRPGDIISQSDVRPIFDKLARHGWKVADRKEIEQAVPADNDFVVQQLRGKGGRTMMRKLAGDPKGYETLDRLSQLPRGRQTVHDLVAAKDGQKLIEYMNNTRGGRNLNKMLSRGPDGRDFKKPTDKIYAVDALLARLKESYLKEQSRRAKANMR